MITSAPRDALGHVVAHAHAHLAQVAGHQRLRADRADLGHAERGQRMDVGARDARVHDVADDRHRELGEVALVVADRVHVEQALRRVRVAAVAGVDHVHVRRAVLGDQVGRAALAVAHDEHVGVHRRQVGDGVEQALALGGADERAMSRLMTSADRRLAAISKVVRVRVLFSKNRLNTLLPRSSGTFFTSRSLTDEEGAGGVEDLRGCTARGRPSIDSRWISSPWALSCGLRLRQHRREPRQSSARRRSVKRPSSSRASDSRCAGGSATRGGGERRLDRQLAPAAVDQHRQRRRSPGGRSRTAR